MKVIVLFALLGAALALPQPSSIDYSKVQSKNIYLEPVNVDAIPPVNGRIIGGTEATPNSLPYQVGLFIDGSGFCGGSLISPNYVLTAAHCTDGATSVEVVLGAHKVQSSESTQVRLTSSNLIVHSGWDSSRLINDVSLIKLPRAVTLTNAIQPISLTPASSGSFEGATSLLSGWGKTSNSGSISSVLMKVNLPVLSNSNCQGIFGSTIQGSHVCTSGTGTKGGCNGDSGGPLVVDGQQIGIVSFGSSSCTAGYPTVFTRVSSFRSWIAQNSDVSL